MSAVCGKRSFCEEFSSPTASKRACCSSLSSTGWHALGSSGVALNLPSNLLVEHLVSLFPAMDKEFLTQALDECEDDLDLAIKKLSGIQFGCANNNMGADASQSDHPSIAINQSEVTINQQQNASPEDPVSLENLPKNGAEWVELFVQEMSSAANFDDARARAAAALESFGASLLARASAEAAHNSLQENTTLKEQAQVLRSQNAILKRAVAIQHEREKEFNDKAHEFEHLKQLIPQYQEQIRKLEVNNYALSMHLKQAQQSNTIPGRFHPDIF